MKKNTRAADKEYCDGNCKLSVTLRSSKSKNKPAAPTAKPKQKSSKKGKEPSIPEQESNDESIPHAQGSSEEQNTVPDDETTAANPVPISDVGTQAESNQQHHTNQQLVQDPTPSDESESEEEQDEPSLQVQPNQVIMAEDAEVAQVPEMMNGLAQIAESLAAMQQQQQNAVQQDKSLAGLPQLRAFTGHADEDVRDFIVQFEAMAALRKWPADQRSHIIGFYLAGHAREWYSSLPADVRSTYAQLIESLKAHYDGQTYLRRQEMNNRVQRSNESVNEYAQDISRRARSLGLSESDTIHKFIQGLLPDLQEHVVMTRPTTYKDAVELATIKSSFQSTKPVCGVSVHPSTEVQVLQSQINDLKEQLRYVNSKHEPEKPTDGLPRQIAAMATAIKTLSSKFSQSTIAAIPQGQGHSPRIPPDQGYDPRRQRNNYGQRWARGQRTTEGDIICYFCRRVGHYKRNCPELQDYQRQAYPPRQQFPQPLQSSQVRQDSPSYRRMPSN